MVSLIVGMVFGNVDVGSVYCIFEVIGGMYDMLYGVGNVIFLFFVFGYNCDVDIICYV